MREIRLQASADVLNHHISMIRQHPSDSKRRCAAARVLAREPTGRRLRERPLGSPPSTLSNVGAATRSTWRAAPSTAPRRVSCFEHRKSALLLVEHLVLLA